MVSKIVKDVYKMVDTLLTAETETGNAFVRRKEYHTKSTSTFARQKVLQMQRVCN